ncbi:MAG TPA: protein translocase subunit SecD [Candidatus Polarisedimenticolia bacterium]|jgi:preprotein translocase subunit SecD|nr:protein translocase subunit SecD [Candidatus Polarisedimenticolia bacterium]
MPLKWRWVLIAFVTLLSVYLCYPLQQKIKLGLDLKGGIHLVMQVKTDDAIKASLDLDMETLRAELAKRGVTPERIEHSGVDRMIVSGVDPAKGSELRELVSAQFSAYDLSAKGGGAFELRLKPAQARAIRETSVRQALETIRNRIDKFGVSEPVVQQIGFAGGGGEQILVQLPGIQNTERVKELIGSPAYLEWKLVSIPPGYRPEDFQRVCPAPQERILSLFNGSLPGDTELYPSEHQQAGETLYWPCKKASPITGKDLKDARRGSGRIGEAVVDFRLTPDAGQRFEDLTRANEGQLLAILLDKKVISAPRINAVIRDSGVIEGSFDVDSAEDLAIKLRSGALPAGMELLEERTVGPSLGADSIRQGIVASLLGAVLVVIFMLVYYRFSGVNANLALALNILLLLGAMAYFRATLTLPGIAGIALTIGMAVDANVLIFERIREELRLGRTVKSAISGGFGKAFSSIVDSNLTTLIAALFLFAYGSGPVRGFAVTLCIGILANLFTAIFVSRAIFDWFLGTKGRVEQLSI